MEQQTMNSKILIFESLQALNQFVDNVSNLYKTELSMYEEELGQMLRQVGHDDDAWAKEIQSKLAPQGKQSAKSDDKKDGKDSIEEKDDKKKKPREKKGKEKGKEDRERKKEEKGRKNSTNWKSYDDIHIFIGNANQGKTEVYFEAVNELKIILEKLDRIRETLARFASLGMGDQLYLIYTKNGVPEKLVLLKNAMREGKFEFRADFVTESMEVPIESREV